jgi:uncharacterized protein with PQ loop repeat
LSQRLDAPGIRISAGDLTSATKLEARTKETTLFIQFLATATTVYGALAALKSLLEARQMLARRTSSGVSARFLASYAGGYAIWLAYGLSVGSLPLIIVDAIGLLCGGLTLALALSLRGSLIRPATWNGHKQDLNRTSAHRPGPVM